MLTFHIWVKVHIFYYDIQNLKKESGFIKCTIYNKREKQMRNKLYECYLLL